MMKFNVPKKIGIKPNTIDKQTIQGFDIELKSEDKEIIDRFVDIYENSILTHLDDEYLRKTTWADRLADRISSFGGSWKFIVYFGFFLAFWMIWK